MKKKSLILTAACAVLILTSSIGSAFAYFSTYERALGGYTLHLTDYTEDTEDFAEWKKTVTIKNKADSHEEVYVRARAIGGSMLNLTYVHNGDWTDGHDGFWYYNNVLKPGEVTSPLDVKIENIPKQDYLKDPKSFKVVVVYEVVKACYQPDGTPYADWNQKMKVTHEVGGDD